MAQLRNTGDEAGTNIRLSWAEGSSGKLDDNPIDRIDPGDFRRLLVAPLSPGRQVVVTWERPGGQTHSVQRELSRHFR